ncbi:MAG TPA: serine hydrolase [Mycobacteriales bacterium]|nr:serine hydrolase [Mycobacteriales bacterium]
MPKRAMQIDDLYRIPAVSEPTLSPDGKWVAYVVTTPERDEDAYRSCIWRVSTAGDQAARRWTTGPRDGAPRWSPDGKQLAYVATDKDGVPQVFVSPTDGGAAAQLTTLRTGVGDLQWSPDGTKLALVSGISLAEQPSDSPVVLDRLGYKFDGAGLLGLRRMHLFVVDVANRTTLQLTAGDFSVNGARWSPDGSTIAYGAEASADSDVTGTSAVYVVPATGGVPQRITPTDATLSTPVWFPDGEQILVAGRERFETGATRLYAVAAAGGAPKPVAMLDRNVMVGAPGYAGARPIVLTDGTILFAARDRGCTHVYGATADTPPDKRIAGSDRSVSGLSTAAGLVAYVVADPTSNGEVAVATVEGSNERVLTTHCSDALADVELAVAEPRLFSAPDGTAIEGWLLRPRERDGATPLLLDIHGGPHNAWSPVFDGVHLYHQELVARGWSVLILNPRASDGYGEEFYRATVANWGVADEGDFLAALDSLVAQGEVDPSRIVVTGYSYGGYMTCWLSARHPARWAAAIPGGVVSDLVGMAGNADVGRLMAGLEFGGQPWSVPDRYRELSPITYVDRVTAPTLILHGEQDDRCPVGQSEAWFGALRMRRVPVELVRYPGGSHLFILNGRPSHRADWCRRIVDWATTHTSGRAVPTRSLASRTRGLQARLAQLCEQYDVPGAAATVLHGDEVVTVVHGIRSVDSNEPVTPQTVFQIGSNTKLYTATLAMQLVDAGLVELDAPVTRYVPEFRLAPEGFADTVTVRHLLTHTSGIPGDIFGPHIPWGDDAISTFVDELKTLEPLGAAGEVWSYCNAGWVLLGRLVESVAGQTFHSAWRQRLVDPIGAVRTRALPDQVLPLEPALGHVSGSDGKPRVAPVYATSPACFPAGSLPVATGEDLIRFVRLHLDGGVAESGERLLSAEAVAAMQTPQVSLPSLGSQRRHWGLGWALGETTDGRRILGHGGGTLGQLSTVEVLPDERLAVVVLTNGMNAMVVGQTLVRELFASLAGAELLPDPKGLEDARSIELAPLEGTYVNGRNKVEATVADAHLVLKVTMVGLTDKEETQEMLLTPVDATRFVGGPAGPVYFLQPDESNRPRYLFSSRAYRRVEG